MNTQKHKNRFILLTAFLLVSSVSMAQKQFAVNGEIAATHNGKKIFLFYKKNGVNLEDSTIVKDGKFMFKGDIGDPSFAKLTLDPPAVQTMQNAKSVDFTDFFIDGGNISLKSANGMKNSVIKGGKTQADYERRFAMYKPIQHKVDSLNLIVEQLMASQNAESLVEVRKELSAEYTKTAKIDSNFIKDNPNSFLALDIWRSKHRGTLRLNFEPEFMRFSPELRKTFTGQEIQKKFDIAKSLAPGKMAPDFTLPDTLGKMFSLSSLHGKNVLVCFYTPDFMNYDSFTFNLGRINRALKDKNVVMVTVYYNYADNSVNYWKETIAKSRFNWMNLSDIGGVNDKGAVSHTAKVYGLSYNTLPTALLIGTDGKILASQLRLSDTDLATDLVKLIK